LTLRKITTRFDSPKAIHFQEVPSLLEIVTAQAANGNLQEVLKTVRLIQDPYWETLALLGILGVLTQKQDRP
jgi:hypothetical protein